MTLSDNSRLPAGNWTVFDGLVAVGDTPSTGIFDVPWPFYGFYFSTTENVTGLGNLVNYQIYKVLGDRNELWADSGGSFSSLALQATNMKLYRTGGIGGKYRIDFSISGAITPVHIRLFVAGC